MPGFKDIDAAGLQELRSGGAILIDVRTDAEVAKGIIAGATHIPLHLLPTRADEIRTDGPTVVYCQMGGRSAQACAFLAARGFGNLYNLQGGITAWARAGNPVEAPE